MTVSYVVEEVMPIAYSPDSVDLLGQFTVLEDAIRLARAYVPKRNEYDGDTFARITVQGWQS